MTIQTLGIQRGSGLSWSLLLDSPPYEDLDEHFPAKSPRHKGNLPTSSFSISLIAKFPRTTRIVL